MANLKSSIKDTLRSARNADQNRQVKSRLKTLHKQFETAVAAGAKDKAAEAGKAFVSAVDKAVKKNVVHSNKADREKATVARRVSAIA
jgi:small subunit ribosomal protein S20